MIEKNPIYNTIITTKARVYRYEAGKFETGRRLWDFGVREFVAVGDREFVRGFLTYFQEKSLEFTNSCKIVAPNSGVPIKTIFIKSPLVFFQNLLLTFYL